MAGITLLYPLAIWFLQGKVEPRVLAGLLLIAALTRIMSLRVSRSSRWWMLGVLFLAAIAAWANALLPLKLYPVFVNGMMLSIFSYSLISPPSVVERLARLQEPNLPVQAVAYTRRVTQVWCVFFFINGVIAFITAVWASPALWSLYNGVIAYVMMGVLFGIEYLVRLRFKRRHHV